MGLKSILFAQIEVKASKDVFHDVFRHKPHHVSTMCPKLVQGCELIEGSFGTVGSKVLWKYNHEGEVVNEYESFKITLHIDEKCETDFVSWTIEYERPNENLPELTTLLQFLIDEIKAIDDHHVKLN